MKSVEGYLCCFFSPGSPGAACCPEMVCKVQRCLLLTVANQSSVDGGTLMLPFVSVGLSAYVPALLGGESKCFAIGLCFNLFISVILRP